MAEATLACSKTCQSEASPPALPNGSRFSRTLPEKITGSCKTITDRSLPAGSSPSDAKQIASADLQMPAQLHSFTRPSSCGSYCWAALACYLKQGNCVHPLKQWELYEEDLNNKLLLMHVKRPDWDFHKILNTQAGNLRTLRMPGSVPGERAQAASGDH